MQLLHGLKLEKIYYLFYKYDFQNIADLHLLKYDVCNVKI